MASVARKIPDAQWESHKAAIRALYLDQDKTLDETVQTMNDLHAFHATKSQFVRRLRNWGFDKNIKSDDWHRAIRGRELEAKEIVINGRTINPKRLKKRLGRSDFKTEDGGGQLARSASPASSPPVSASPSPSPTTTPRAEPKWDELPDTPLLAAVRYRDLSSVQGLLDFGAAISLDPCSPHHRPFITAINQGYTLILQSLLAACRQRPDDSPGNMPSDHHIRGYNALLRRAVNSLNTDSTLCLLNCGAEISSIRGMPCFSKLEEPRRKKAINMIVMLVEKGADINGYSEQDGTEPFLSTAVRCEDYAVVSFLLRRGADPTQFPSSGTCSPLHLSVKARDSIFGGEALRALVAHGADVDGYENVSNVHVPVGDDMSCEIESMLEDLVDRKQRPRTFAFRATPLQAACLYSKEKLLRSLIVAGVDVNAAPAAADGGFTAMQIVCLRGFAPLLEILLEAGADVNGPPAGVAGYALTALQCALIGGHRDMAVRLLNAGAQVNAPAGPELGMTALHIAVHQGDIEMIGLLGDAGATA